ncbi:MAG: 3-keto-5-aminohexanoate cleavage protein [Roseiflexaceae bacterium]
MLIKACLNGSRAPGAHPALPLTPAQLADAARAAVAAGAGALHIHPRRADGSQSFAPDDVAAAVAAVRAACPGMPVGGTTAAWVEPDSARRLALVQSWTTCPDFVSVNFSEEGTEQLCAALLQSGVGIEAGLASADDARLLIASGLADRCVRLLIEPDDQATVAATLAIAQAIVALLDRADIRTPRLMHGSEAATWPLLDEALRCGYDTRIGLEDTLVLPDGSSARDNAQLVATACERAARAIRNRVH